MSYIGKGNFKRTNTKKFSYDPSEYVSLGIEEKDVDFYKEIFDLIDVKSKGYISPNDLKSAMKLFGFEPQKDIVYKIISQVDKSESGGIRFSEFLKIMTG